MDRLLKIGFCKVGTWRIKDAGIAYHLDRTSSLPHTLYAFLVDGHVRYVGKTTQTLRGRLNSYCKPSATQRTNLRNHASILGALSAGQTVEIWALPDEGLHHYGVFHLNLAAGLEDSIIQTLQPDWNGGRRTPAEDEVEEVQPAVPSKPASTFVFTMQPTYWARGFFNVGMANSASLGADGQPIEIYCGDAADPILGSINRTANTNGTPRIFGGRALRVWVQANVEEMAQVRVDVLTPTAIRLTTAGT